MRLPSYGEVSSSRVGGETCLKLFEGDSDRPLESDQESVTLHTTLKPKHIVFSPLVMNKASLIFERAV